jgi:hypothetical protein
MRQDSAVENEKEHESNGQEICLTRKFTKDEFLEYIKGRFRNVGVEVEKGEAERTEKLADFLLSFLV